MKTQDALRIRANDPNRLVHREGRTVTLKVVNEASDLLKRAAKQVEDEYFSFTTGWDTIANWTAYVFLLIESESVVKPNYPEYWEFPVGPSMIDPAKQSDWKPQIGRAHKEKQIRESMILLNSRAMAFAPSTI